VSLTPYRRRPTRVVQVGDLGVGGANPIRVQSMTTPATTDVKATVDQIVRLVAAGCEIVRVTVPSKADAEALPEIRRELKRRALRVPLVADIHFTPAAAMLAVEHVDKVRINPGNFADKKKFAQREYTDAEYEGEIERIAEKFTPLVLRAKELGVALRIGTNHGSLSDRIMNRYGDSALGMVESALEFVRIAEAHGHRGLIISMKSSNPLVCIEAYRLLARRMAEEGMDYPFHLGVTEAGDGEDGRVKSAVGMGALLEEGIGDTVRVSLTEDPVAEVPVAFALAKPYNDRLSRSPVGVWEPSPMRGGYARRWTQVVEVGPLKYGGANPPVVELGLAVAGRSGEALAESLVPLLRREGAPELVELGVDALAEAEAVVALRRLLDRGSLATPLAVRLAPALVGDDAIVAQLAGSAQRIAGLPPALLGENAWRTALGRLLDQVRGAGAVYLASAGSDDVSAFTGGPAAAVLAALDEAQARGVEVLCGLEALGREEATAEARDLVAAVDARGLKLPVVLAADACLLGGDAVVDPAVVLGTVLADGTGDALRVSGSASAESDLSLAWAILQATRLRISRAEFISCPSCGRTLFDLETTTQRIKSRTGHLKGVKIAIMGCIVNGPGEMADADFGYVGWGPGKINLYVGRECVVRDVPEAEADLRLVDLIKSHGRWVEPPPA